MFDTAIAHLRFGLSTTLGARFNVRSLERIVEAMRETHHEFGEFGADADELVAGPSLEGDARRELHHRRFRRQARRAAETAYYGRLFSELGIEPETLRQEDLERIPVTSKAALRADPDAFVRPSATPSLRATTTGTTGRPAAVAFSEHELKSHSALTAISLLHRGQVEPEDVVLIGMRTRATVTTLAVAQGCGQIGAPTQVLGIVDPRHALALLSERRSVHGKRSRVSVLATYPSYLGEIVERGLEAGYRAADFGLRRVLLGGEIATEGLKRRCRRLFGAIEVTEAYGVTELVPFGAAECVEGHLHFQPTNGLLEVHDLESSGSAPSESPGSIVATPFPPLRETTPLLRYDTEDVVWPLSEPLDCPMRGLPATSPLLGKSTLSVRHDRGWTFPREVVEALESVEAIPLPARYDFSAAPGGVAVEVVAKSGGRRVNREIEAALESRGVPARRLLVRANPGQLRRLRPLRCDLKEGLAAPWGVADARLGSPAVRAGN